MGRLDKLIEVVNQSWHLCLQVKEEGKSLGEVRLIAIIGRYIYEARNNVLNEITNQKTICSKKCFYSDVLNT